MDRDKIQTALDKVRAIAKARCGEDQATIEHHIKIAAERLLRYFRYNAFLKDPEYDLLREFNKHNTVSTGVWPDKKTAQDQTDDGDQEDVIDADIVSARDVDEPALLPGRILAPPGGGRQLNGSVSAGCLV